MKKQRKFTPELKARICLQILSGAKTTAQVCREQQLNEQVVGRWKKQFVEQASLVFERESTSASDSERVAELERMVGRLTMELEVAKKPRRPSANSQREAAGSRKFSGQLPGHSRVRGA